MNNAFNGLISRLDMAKERSSELEDMSIETSKTEKQREQRLKETEQNIYKDCGSNYKRCSVHLMGIPEGEENSIRQ